MGRDAQEREASGALRLRAGVIKLKAKFEPFGDEVSEGPDIFVGGEGDEDLT